ncbi:MAG: ATP-binding protein, partial [Oscillospiraceae bacterium]
VGCALYKIDLSQIMDKYVGESEKKLKEIFENASKANIMLLFDEADSLFSKRTQVGSSNDRYANTQTAFLLQQIEEYDGVSVLTTNCMGNFDEAFKRRIQYFVSFPMPSVKQRLEIWERVIPTSLERAEELNLSFIAEAFELSGSSIKAAATSAVFMAVGKGEKLSREHLRLALRDELLKQGRVYMTSDFAGYDNI